METLSLADFMKNGHFDKSLRVMKNDEEFCVAICDEAELIDLVVPKKAALGEIRDHFSEEMSAHLDDDFSEFGDDLADSPAPIDSTKSKDSKGGA